MMPGTDDSRAASRPRTALRPLAHAQPHPWLHMRPSPARPDPAPRGTFPPALDDPSMLDVAVVARMLDADLESGLGGREAAQRLARDGPNEVRAAPPTPPWRGMLAQFQDPLVYLLLAAIVIALLACL